MSRLDYRLYVERHRPHIHPLGANLFVTYRLAGSVPKTTVWRYKARRKWLANELARVKGAVKSSDDSSLKAWYERVETFNREWFAKFETILHKAQCGPTWMKDERVACEVMESIHRLDGVAYRLDAACVMSNHVHVVFEPLLTETELREAYLPDENLFSNVIHPGLSRIMHKLKGGSARACNVLLSRSGQFWEHESFDRVIREGRYYSTIGYVLNNPVKARLVKDWRQWRWNYCRKELEKYFEG